MFSSAWIAMALVALVGLALLVLFVASAIRESRLRAEPLSEDEQRELSIDRP